MRPLRLIFCSSDATFFTFFSTIFFALRFLFSCGLLSMETFEYRQIERKENTLRWHSPQCKLIWRHSNQFSIDKNISILFWQCVWARDYYSLVDSIFWRSCSNSKIQSKNKSTEEKNGKKWIRNVRMLSMIIHIIDVKFLFAFGWRWMVLRGINDYVLTTIENCLLVFDFEIIFHFFFSSVRVWNIYLAHFWDVRNIELLEYPIFLYKMYVYYTLYTAHTHTHWIKCITNCPWPDCHSSLKRISEAKSDPFRRVHLSELLVRCVFHSCFPFGSSLLKSIHVL